jgi:hypothetical protein
VLWFGAPESQCPRLHSPSISLAATGRTNPRFSPRANGVMDPNPSIGGSDQHTIRINLCAMEASAFIELLWVSLDQKGRRPTLIRIGAS